MKASYKIIKKTLIWGCDLSEERVIFPAEKLVLGFPVNGNGQVLLSVRRKTPWMGCLSGLGGNLEKIDRGLFDALRRESLQEAKIKIRPIHVENRGIFEVYREGKKMLMLYAYLIYHFEGEPVITEEMGPHSLFPTQKLPAGMVPGDEHWVGRMLKGEFLKGQIYRSADAERLIDIKIESCLHL